MSLYSALHSKSNAIDFLISKGIPNDGCIYAVGSRAWDGYSLNFVDGVWELASTARSTHYDVIARITSEREAYLLLIAEVMIALGKWE